MELTLGPTIETASPWERRALGSGGHALHRDDSCGRRVPAHSARDAALFPVDPVLSIALDQGAQMPRFLTELKQHPEKGLLGMEYFVYWRGIALVQYCRSFEDLERFARDTGDRHLPGWRWFNQTIVADFRRSTNRGRSVPSALHAHHRLMCQSQMSLEQSITYEREVIRLDQACSS